MNGFINKNTILYFTNTDSMFSYTPVSNNKIGIDSSTNSYYIYNDGKWRIFKENAPTSYASHYWGSGYLIRPEYTYSGNASHSISNNTTFISQTVQVSNSATFKYFVISDANSLRESVYAATSSNQLIINFEIYHISQDISASVR